VRADRAWVDERLAHDESERPEVDPIARLQAIEEAVVPAGSGLDGAAERVPVLVGDVVAGELAQRPPELVDHSVEREDPAQAEGLQVDRSRAVEVIGAVEAPGHPFNVDAECSSTSRGISSHESFDASSKRASS
jgi:hypothetical protein